MMAVDRDDVLSIRLTDDELLRLTTVSLEDLGRTVGRILQRRQANLLCERDGHEPDQYLGQLCQRCGKVLMRIAE